MRAVRRFFRRLTWWVTTEGDEERLRAEIEEHLALQTADNLRAGLSPGEARRQALLKFGGVEVTKESFREQRGLPFLETLIQDTRYALRRLRMAPAFSIATVLILALGVGATTAIFTLVHAVLLKSLPVAKPEELYRLGKESRCCYLGGYSQDREFSLVSYDLYKFLRDHTTGFYELAAFPAATPLFGVRRAGSPEAAQTYPGEFVSGNYFIMFGIGGYAGRVLIPNDDRPGAPPVAVMSYRLWQERYRSDPSVVGSAFNLNEKPVTVVGIAPPDFFGDTLRPTPPDWFLPLNAEPYLQVDADLNKYATHWLELIGRIHPGADPASIEAEMRVELEQWLRAHWGEMSANERARFPEQTLYLSPGGAGISSMRERTEQWLRILMMVTGFVLLIVCANIAGLMLVRGLERRRQASLCLVLGARAARVIRQSLVESILLSLFGGALGLGVAFAGARLIVDFAFPRLLGWAAVPIGTAPSMPVLLFALGTSLVTGIAFGITPAWLTARIDPIEALRGHHSTARTGSLPRQALVVSQAALSLVLLSASGLLTSALFKLEHQDLGFDPDRRIVVNMNPRLAGYQTDQLPALYRRLYDSITSIPAVSSAAVCLYAPQSGGGWGALVRVEGHPPPGPRDDDTASWDRVTAGYFDAIGTPILRGRALSAEDSETTRKVAIVNEAFARKFFRKEDPIGRHFSASVGPDHNFEVVGVAKDARILTDDLGRPVHPFFYVPASQADYTQRNIGSLFLTYIVIRTKPRASLPNARIREALASVDPDMPIVSIRALSDLVATQLSQQRLIARLISFFGLLSLVLACVGLYGVTAYNAGRRKGEIGVRVALGARREDIIRLVLRGAFGLIFSGLLIGLPLTFAAGRLLGSQLPGIDPYNPLVTLSAVLALGLSSLVASLVPAFRASGQLDLHYLRHL
jgi:predicted permease